MCVHELHRCMHTVNLSTGVERTPEPSESGNGLLSHFCPTIHIRTLALIRSWPNCKVVCNYTYIQSKHQIYVWMKNTYKRCVGGKQELFIYLKSAYKRDKSSGEKACAAKQWEKVPSIVWNKFHTVSQSDHWLKNHATESTMHVYIRTVFCAPVFNGIVSPF